MNLDIYAEGSFLIVLIMMFLDAFLDLLDLFDNFQSFRKSVSTGFGSRFGWGTIFPDLTMLNLQVSGIDSLGGRPLFETSRC